ncbi:uncharacterized protein EV422DRAFT_234246 [Fimicolochytrium jonesii]|uniref:uncharacterized protein n=1 Tax=Fimicolochytrium jonesii TaxID=1396493 RepID=UPI0022FEB34B|nr:uncharacterized protein EV422DRAFT_234246 [Fimicolochytrium jonesii]KAI8824811.1 hypothetical protein EV422DRAFT_234246 [Fimicolochytrium jonesii]
MTPTRFLEESLNYKFTPGIITRASSAGDVNLFEESFGNATEPSADGKGAANPPKQGTEASPQQQLTHNVSSTTQGPNAAPTANAGPAWSGLAPEQPVMTPFTASIQALLQDVGDVSMPSLPVVSQNLQPPPPQHHEGPGSRRASFGAVPVSSGIVDNGAPVQQSSGQHAFQLHIPADRNQRRRYSDAHQPHYAQQGGAVPTQVPIDPSNGAIPGYGMDGYRYPQQPLPPHQQQSPPQPSQQQAQQYLQQMYTSNPTQPHPSHPQQQQPAYSMAVDMHGQPIAMPIPMGMSVPMGPPMQPHMQQPLAIPVMAPQMQDPNDMSYQMQQQHPQQPNMGMPASQEEFYHHQQQMQMMSQPPQQQMQHSGAPTVHPSQLYTSPNYPQDGQGYHQQPPQQMQGPSPQQQQYQPPKLHQPSKSRRTSISKSAATAAEPRTQSPPKAVKPTTGSKQTGKSRRDSGTSQLQPASGALSEDTLVAKPGAGTPASGPAKKRKRTASGAVAPNAGEKDGIAASKVGGESQNAEDDANVSSGKKKKAPTSVGKKVAGKKDDSSAAAETAKVEAEKNPTAPNSVAGDDMGDYHSSDSESDGEGGSKSPTSGKRKHPPTEAERAAKRKRFLERNRVAASKCRMKKKEWLKELETKSATLSKENERLVSCVKDLKEEVLLLKSQLLLHRACDCNVIQQYIQTSSQVC